ncbi:uncharacterized protein LOC135845092 [Planococcus citri]|uniref:uncharacterized protein LOC135845092 n=1 Tax=Planococcus citri TaxID=170843 RepID=UPI0031F7278F
MDSIEEWSDFFAQVGFKEATAYTFAEKFTNANIRKEDLETISEKDLKELGILKFGDRKLITFHIQRETNKMPAAVEVVNSNEVPGDAFETSKFAQRENKSAGSANSPVKKKTKVEEFLELVSRKPISVAAVKAGSIIQELECSLRAEKKYRFILWIRWRIEVLEKLIGVPDSDPISGKPITSRYEKWIAFFSKKTDRYVIEMEDKIKDHGSTIDLFCKAVRVLYGDFVDPAAYYIRRPDEITGGDIDNVLELIGVAGNLSVKAAIEVLIEPIRG